jgi:hypothetical protein
MKDLLILTSSQGYSKGCPKKYSRFDLTEGHPEDIRASPRTCAQFDGMPGAQSEGAQ